MYINDVHILIYIVFLILGLVIGQFLQWVNKRILENKKVFSKEIKNEIYKKITINRFATTFIAIMYVIILYKFSIKKTLLENLDLIKYLLLLPILTSIMTIDYKEKIIPNRLTLTLFETGILFTFLYSINNLFVARNYLIGMIVGALIFGIIAIIGRIIAGKEAMGMGDIKLIATLGLYFGTALIVSISIISFIIAGIISIVIIKSKKRKSEDYITFGPCICISAMLCIIIPENLIISILLTIFTLGRYHG